MVLRQLNGLVAGTTGMRWLHFLAANPAGAALWVGLWATLAYRFGHTTDIVPFLWHHLNLVAAVGVPLLIAGLAYLRLPPGAVAERLTGRQGRRPVKRLMPVGMRMPSALSN